MPLPLNGKRIALAEGRQLEELATLLEKEGAVIIRCPMVSMLDAPDPEPIRTWIDELIAGRFDIVVLLTGEGLRRMLPVAEKANKREAFVTALSQATILARGPKPGAALKELGLKPSLIAAKPTTDGVIATLKDQDLRGKTVGVQLYGEDNPALVGFLTAAGAVVRTVRPYLYAPASDAEQVVGLIHEAAIGMIDAIVFTSSPQVDRIYGVIKERGLRDRWDEALAKTKIASVGPLVSEAIIERCGRVDIQPQQGFQMKNLVVHICKAFHGA